MDEWLLLVDRLMTDKWEDVQTLDGFIQCHASLIVCHICVCT